MAQDKRIAKVGTVPSRDAKRHVLETWNRGQPVGERAAASDGTDTMWKPGLHCTDNGGE